MCIPIPAMAHTELCKTKPVMVAHAGRTFGRNSQEDQRCRAAVMLGVVLPMAVAHGHLWFLHAAGVSGPHVRRSAPTAAWGNAALEPDLPAVPAAHASRHPGERDRVRRGWQRLML